MTKKVKDAKRMKAVDKVIDTLHSGRMFEMREAIEEYSFLINNECPCCSKQLTEGCCIECGEVYE